MRRTVLKLGPLLIGCLVLLACEPASPADGFPRRVPVGVDGAHPLVVRDLWSLSAAGNGNPENPIALTFDDGPSSYTNQIADVLASRHIAATFFVVGQQIAGQEAVIQRVNGLGNRIGVHSWSHKNLTTVSFPTLVHEVVDTQAALNGLVGEDKVRCMRPPGGNLNQTVTNLAAANGLAAVLWNIDPTDWKRPPPNDIYNAVVRAARPGAIILLHDGGGDRSNTVSALGAIIDTLQARGYTFVTVC